ncbi:hypothetical protein MT418_006722 [Batrachochytrium dendrobatidis]
MFFPPSCVLPSPISPTDNCAKPAALSDALCLSSNFSTADTVSNANILSPVLDKSSTIHSRFDVNDAIAGTGRPPLAPISADTTSGSANSLKIVLHGLPVEIPSKTPDRNNFNRLSFEYSQESNLEAHGHAYKGVVSDSANIGTENKATDHAYVDYVSHTDGTADSSTPSLVSPSHDESQITVSSFIIKSHEKPTHYSRSSSVSASCINYKKFTRDTLHHIKVYHDSLLMLADCAEAKLKRYVPRFGIMADKHVPIVNGNTAIPLEFTMIAAAVEQPDISQKHTVSRQISDVSILGSRSSHPRHGISRFAPYGYRFAATMKDGSVCQSHVAGDLADRARLNGARGTRSDLVLVSHIGETTQLQSSLEYCDAQQATTGIRPGPSDVLKHLREVGLDIDYRKEGNVKLQQRNASNFYKRMTEYAKKMHNGEYPINSDISGSVDVGISSIGNGSCHDPKEFDGVNAIIDAAAMIKDNFAFTVPSDCFWTPCTAASDAVPGCHVEHSKLKHADSADYTTLISTQNVDEISDDEHGLTISTNAEALQTHIQLTTDSETDFDWGMDDDVDVDDGDEEYVDKKSNHVASRRRSISSVSPRSSRVPFYKKSSKSSIKQLSMSSLLNSGCTNGDHSISVSQCTPHRTCASRDLPIGTSLAMRSLYKKGLSRHSPYGTRFSALMEDGTIRESYLAGDLIHRARASSGRGRGDLNLVRHHGEASQLESAWTFYKLYTAVNHIIPGASIVLDHLRKEKLDINHRENGGLLLQKNAGNLHKRVQEFGRRRTDDMYYLREDAMHVEAADFEMAQARAIANGFVEFDLNDYLAERKGAGVAPL